MTYIETIQNAFALTDGTLLYLMFCTELSSRIISAGRNISHGPVHTTRALLFVNKQMICMLARSWSGSSIGESAQNASCPFGLPSLGTG